jgi:hypothetical protein
MASRTSLLSLALFATTLTAQPTIAAPARTAAPDAAALPSAAIQPSLDVLRTAINQLRIDRWKASTPIRSEAQNNLASVQRDLQTTLPALLATADAAPGSAAKVLPAYRNVEALYDVTLRLVVAARLAASPNEMSALDQALGRLDDSRHLLGDQLQHDSDAQETQVLHLQAALKAVPPPQPPPPVVAPVKCPVTTPRRRTTAKKPTTSSTSHTTTTPTH